MLKAIKTALQIACVAASLAARAESYIVPVWAQSLSGIDGTWVTQTTAINPSSQPVTVRVVRSFPLQTTNCSECAPTVIEKIIGPFASLPLNPPSPFTGARMTSGAFEVESSAPIVIQHVAYL